MNYQLTSCKMSAKPKKTSSLKYLAYIAYGQHVMQNKFYKILANKMET